MSDIYGEKGFELFKYCFERLVNKELTVEFRNKVMMALSFSWNTNCSKWTSLPHGMGHPLTYFKGLPHGLANGVLTMEYLKSFKDKTKIERMLNILGFSNFGKIEIPIFNRLIDVKIEITEDEINEYSKNFFASKKKLENHTEEVSLEEIINIYRESLLKN